MLDRKLHGAVGLRFAGAAEEFDDVVRTEFGEV